MAALLLFLGRTTEELAVIYRHKRPRFLSRRCHRSLEALKDTPGGFSLVETLVATGMLAAAVVSLGQLFTLSTRTNLGSRHASVSSILAAQKVEELRALTWGLDTQGFPVSDTSTDTTSSPESPAGGTGLSPSPNTTLQQNTPGYVDYIDRVGNKLGGGSVPPDATAYIRRWSVAPLPANPNNTLVIQVLVTPHRNRGSANFSSVARLPGEARLVTVKTRKAR